ncbi:MAG: hypothetical protein NT135_01895 [Candidatus Berkelbacteria bacterium]|nr:hypothetical protein [Candidatus Berkelbacteria bacterium]
MANNQAITDGLKQLRNMEINGILIPTIMKNTRECLEFISELLDPTLYSEALEIIDKATEFQSHIPDSSDIEHDLQNSPRVELGKYALGLSRVSSHLNELLKSETTAKQIRTMPQERARNFQRIIDLLLKRLDQTAKAYQSTWDSMNYA